MAAVIAFAQAKGGVGKTTAAIGLALELAERGYHVRLIDCDTNHHSAEFGMVNQMPELTVIPALNPDLSPSDHGQPQITEKNLYGEIARSEREGAEVILIDLPGVLSRVGLTAMMRAHLVVIPSRDSMMDARDAVSTLADIDLARQSTGRKIEARALMSAIPASIETKWARAVKEQLAQNGLVVMKVEVILREAFKDMMAAGTHPLRIDLEQYLQKDRRAKRAALEKSAENLAALADEILGILEATQQSAVEEV